MIRARDEADANLTNQSSLTHQALTGVEAVRESLNFIPFIAKMEYKDDFYQVEYRFDKLS